MAKLFANKYFLLLIIMIGAKILLSMIESQIEDRSKNRQHARALIAKSWTGDQTIIAGILSIPIERLVSTQVFDVHLNRNTEKKVWQKENFFIVAEQLTINSKLTHQLLSKGIYRVPVYSSVITLDGKFHLDSIQALRNDENVNILGSAILNFGISDPRGILSNPQIFVANVSQAVSPSSQLAFFSTGFHSPLKLTELDNEFSFETKLQLKGMSKIKFIAAGKQNEVWVKSDWPHPNFFGAFLPVHREISDQGYIAQWKTGTFSTDIENILKQCQQDHCANLFESSFGVDQIEAVDIYLKSLRSIKYGILVVIITFTILVLYEVLQKKIRIHPISYSLTAMALAMFFLLLIAFSEHLNFAIAYWISAIACSCLLGYYLGHLAGSKKQGALFFGVLNTFYLILFFIIRSEDHALLSGALLLFSLLALVMSITKRVDWYQLGDKF